MARIIRQVMEEMEVTRQDISRSHARQTVYGKASFECSTCDNQWTSHRAWAEIDLKRQCLAKRWRQGCRECGEMTGDPLWAEVVLEDMVEFAVNRHFEQVNGDATSKRKTGGGRSRTPHEQSLCERCQQLGRPCFGGDSEEEDEEDSDESEDEDCSGEEEGSDDEYDDDDYYHYD